MVYEEIGAEAFPGLSQEGFCRSLIPLPIGAEVADLNYGPPRQWNNTKRLLDAGDERHKVSIDDKRSCFIPIIGPLLSSPSKAGAQRNGETVCQVPPPRIAPHKKDDTLCTQEHA